MQPMLPSTRLSDVNYGIRGDLAIRARELEYLGYDVISLSIGNPGAYGFRTAEPIRLAIVENLKAGEAYIHEKGLSQAREAVVRQQRRRGVQGVVANDVYIGNGVSELIDMVLRGLLNEGDEVLVPRPDYPLWTAAVTLNHGRAVSYACAPEMGFEPDLDDIATLVNQRTRAIVVINPNNPTGAVYARNTLEGIARVAEQYNLLVLSDEIYDQTLYDNAQFVPMATVVRNGVCATFSGLSKSHLACGYRVGWVSFSGEVERAREYLNALDKLASLRLCSNVLGQFAVQPALNSPAEILNHTCPNGRLYQSRQAILDCVRNSKYLRVHVPMGGLYAFIALREELLRNFDDHAFALDLLHKKHVLVTPGSSFNMVCRSYFRVTNLPTPDVLIAAFQRIEDLLDSYTSASRRRDRAPSLRIVTEQ
jgi:alanine-synthesizing transaminase